MFSKQTPCYRLLLAFLFFGFVASGETWHYGHEDTWPKMCKEGKRQSPISIDRRKSARKNFSPFIFKNYNKIYSTMLKNNGHSAEVRLKTDEVLTVEGGGLQEVYILDHLHFHWQSEHVIDGYRYPLELHLVHYGKSYGNLSNAVGNEKGVAVFSVLFDLSPDDDVEFTGFIALIDKLKETLDKGERLEDFHIHDYLPRDTAGFYRYLGSLTTPNCTEGIVWTIFTNTIPISESQVKIFHSLKTEEHKELTKNYRPLQKLNGRKVYLKVSPIHKSSRASSLLNAINRDMFLLISILTVSLLY
ncbi:putative carbonic anhydrase 3 isoform X2 [Harmonia axyridis]|uniref:putative carbonic anhydrase 3 isoform X2 n=1 Tax=Harmonia axyridis TaxID=115357 RepID=UPI001E276C24|nr:putative carbonic anhydrase 3 isoform X2 [Harmonia axyridis]